MAGLIKSFGFRHGDPYGTGTPADLIVDVRKSWNRNPWRETALRVLPGTHPRVADWLEQDPGLPALVADLTDTARRTRGVLWIGCTGGQHRSVYLADRIGRELGIPVSHRDLGKGDRPVADLGKGDR